MAPPGKDDDLPSRSAMVRRKAEANAMIGERRNTKMNKGS